MLIYLDHTAVDAALRGDEKDRSLKAIDNLLRAHDERKHLLVVDASARRLLASDLSKWARGALKFLLATRAETGDLPRRLPVHVAVGAGPEFDGRLLRRGSQRVFQQPVTSFEDPEHASRSVLVAEHAVDAKIYIELGRALLFKEHRHFRAPSMEPRLGGGSTLPEAFKLALESGRMTLVVADSDRDAPGSSVGSTALTLRHAVSAVDGWIADLHDASQDRLPSRGPRVPLCAVLLHVRMLENMIPLAMYEEALPSPKIAALRDLRERASSLPWLAHAHLKDGLRLRQVQEKTGANHTFWQEACRAFDYEQCRQAQPCEEVKHCTCWVIEPLDSHAPSRILEWLEEASLRHAARLWGLEDGDSSRAVPEVRQLAEWVMCWGFAPAGARAST